MTPAALAALFRSHSRLEGTLAGNLETWLAEPGTLPRYLALVPKPAAGETKLLEIGCYQPTVGYYFSLGWRDVIGTFVTEGEGTEVTHYEDPSGANVRLVMVDAEHAPLPVADGWADAVLMMQVWEHFATDPMHVLWEVNRVLKVGGRFVLSTPNGACWQYALRIAFGRAAWAGMEFTGFSNNRHNRLYDADELRLILSQAGFQATRLGSRDFGDPPIGWRERVFRGALSGLDAVASLNTGRVRERGTTLFIEATKTGPPRERFPASLYLTEHDWPGITQQRDQILGGAAK
jgi:SAM-dependent methyltransferase